MKYGQIREYDVANGKGIRTTIFVTGCTHNCFNCFNKEYQDFSYGEEWTSEETNLVRQYLNKKEIRGLSLLGGEPMLNVEGLLQVIHSLRYDLREDQDIWLWSGYTYEEILEDPLKLSLLKEIDVLIDGKFVQSKKDLSLKFRGSSNQRIINVQKSLASNKIVLWEEGD